MSFNSREHLYEETLMYGQYRKALAKFAREESDKVYAQVRDKELRNELMVEKKEWISNPRLKGLLNFMEHWFLLAILGIIMGIVGFAVDEAILVSRQAHLWLFEQSKSHSLLQYLAWVMFPITYILFSAGILKVLVPQAAGAGIPEMKTIIRGTKIKGYLSFKALIAKTFSIIASMGSGFPLGREGSLVHISCYIAHLLSSLVKKDKGVYENECHWQEMLGAAAAVGVAVSFASPIGGVLFSIEVTTEYFAVRNYWYGFFSSMCATVVFRMMSVWVNSEETLSALFRVHFELDVPFDPEELILYAILGLFLGFIGAAFVYSCNFIVHFNRSLKTLNSFLQQHWPIYPAFVALVLASITFPLGIGKLTASEFTPSQLFTIFFNNQSWLNYSDIPTARDNFMNSDSARNNFMNFKDWNTAQSIFFTLSMFAILNFVMAALVTSIPIANGVFVPNVVIGGAIGRLSGEVLAYCFPNGFVIGSKTFTIKPGSYAIAGAAALGGSATHTVSAAVIICEITGQILLIIPVAVSVLISNAVCSCLQPSFYDMVIRNKKLPYLPPLESNFPRTLYDLVAEDFMVKDVKFIAHDANYREVSKVLESSPDIRSFPLVENSTNEILIGSIQRVELQYMIHKHLKKGLFDHMMKNNERNKIDKQKPDQNLLPTSSTPIPTIVVSFVDEEEEHILKPVIPKVESFCKLNLSVERLRKGHMSKFTTSAHNSPKLLHHPKSFVRSNKKHFHSDTNLDKYLKQNLENSWEHIENDLKVWEEECLEEPFNFEDCKIDQAPFQVVEKTTLHKIQTLFSMLSLTHMYVTSLNKLVGIISLKELCNILENPLAKETLPRNERLNAIPADAITTGSNDDTMVTHDLSTGSINCHNTRNDTLTLTGSNDDNMANHDLSTGSNNCHNTRNDTLSLTGSNDFSNVSNSTFSLYVSDSDNDSEKSTSF